MTTAGLEPATFAGAGPSRGMRHILFDNLRPYIGDRSQMRYHCARKPQGRELQPSHDVILEVSVVCITVSSFKMAVVQQWQRKVIHQ